MRELLFAAACPPLALLSTASRAFRLLGAPLEGGRGSTEGCHQWPLSFDCSRRVTNASSSSASVTSTG